jgi:uncharacterized iron-regulated membrane protein
MATRIVWRYLHLWIGVGCGLFLLILGVSGSVLLFAPELDKITRSALYATHDGAVAQPLATYIDVARRAVPNGDPATIRWPAGPGQPMTVLLRLQADHKPRGEAADAGTSGTPEHHRHRADAAAAAEQQDHGARHDDGPARRADQGQGSRGGRPRMLMAYLDPPTAALLGTADPRGGVVGWIRSLHTDLLVPMFAGRQIVGWIGAGLLVLSLTGVYLWWPRNAGFLRGLAWRRSPKVVTNLHHRIGFWIAVPIAIMAFTGVYQAFPQQLQAAMFFVAPVAQTSRQGFGPLLSSPKLSPQEAVDAASRESASYKPLSLAFPSEAVPSWRIQLGSDDGDVRTVLIDDATMAVSTPPQQLRGDAILGWFRQLHEHARDRGPVWIAIALAAGLSVPLLMVTGVIMWLRRRKAAAALRALKAGSSAAAVAAE